MASGRTLFCRVITPERIVFDGEVEMVVATISDGEIGVLADHVPIISTMKIGNVRLNRGSAERKVFATSDGFFKVSENLVQVLVEEAVPVEEIDVTSAERRISEAERELEEAGDAKEVERRIKIGENLVQVARKYGEG